MMCCSQMTWLRAGSRLKDTSFFKKKKKNVLFQTQKTQYGTKYRAVGELKEQLLILN